MSTLIAFDRCLQLTNIEYTLLQCVQIDRLIDMICLQNIRIQHFIT